MVFLLYLLLLSALGLGVCLFILSLQLNAWFFTNLSNRRKVIQLNTAIVVGHSIIFALMLSNLNPILYSVLGETFTTNLRLSLIILDAYIVPTGLLQYGICRVGYAIVTKSTNRVNQLDTIIES